MEHSMFVTTEKFSEMLHEFNHISDDCFAHFMIIAIEGFSITIMVDEIC